MRVKKARRQLPCSPFDLKGLEEWLEEMARLGLFLHKIDNNRAVFLLGEPQPLRYRLDPMSKGYIPEERRLLYAQAGWEFVTTMPMEYFYIYSCADPEAPELHSDPQVLAYAMNRTIRRYSLVNFSSILLAIILIVFAVVQYGAFIRSSILLGFSPHGLVNLIFQAAIMTGLCATCASQYRTLYRTRKALRLGAPIPRSRSWRRLPLAITLLLLFLSYQGSELVLERAPVFPHTEAEASALSHPWPTLAQLLETGPRVYDRTELIQTSAEVYRAPLAPVQEKLSAQGDLTWRGAPLRPTLELSYIQARWETVARWLAQDQETIQDRTLKSYLPNPAVHFVSREIDADSYSGFAALDRPGWDSLSVATFYRNGQDSWSFVARRGSQVLVVTVTGYTDLDACLDLYLAALSTGN